MIVLRRVTASALNLSAAAPVSPATPAKPRHFFVDAERPVGDESPAIRLGRRLPILRSEFGISAPENPFLVATTEEALDELVDGLLLKADFVSEEEEAELVDELNPVLRKMRYEKSHWDDAIHDYRETEKIEWREANAAVVERLRAFAFRAESSKPLPHAHILDVSEKGFIKPHVDAVRFCGDTVAGISLLSDSVMRFTKEKEPSLSGDLLLPRRSLYVMRDVARFLYSHALLPDADSFFNGNKINKGRRISVICRNAPLPGAG